MLQLQVLQGLRSRSGDGFLVVNYLFVDSSGTVLEFSRIILQRNDLRGSLALL
jgi:hypothetical protein